VKEKEGVCRDEQKPLRSDLSGEGLLYRAAEQNVGFGTYF